MHIKHIVLDGFKSYRERTDVGPFDPHFNAITGLNGSGKSNVLDAICFVLGLSSLQLVRAQNLGDLVYKGGVGGVNRAAASIIFDNRDKSPGKCPPRYEKYDEIIVSRTVESTGTCKYFLNSITATKKEVIGLFESVQLNISNPNFVIMQGKITKVIAMSPKQILMMIEETVGGNVYQGKRDKCEQELLNKERCIASTQEVIDADIYPEYKKQKDARDRLIEFQDIEQRKTKISKYVCLLSYKTTKDNLVQNQGELEKLCEKERDDEMRIEEYKSEIEDNKKRQEQMKKENTQKFKGKIETAEKELGAEKKSYLKVEAETNSIKLNVEDCKKKVKDAEAAKAKEEKEMENYKKKSANTVGEFEAVKNEIKNAETQLAKAKEREEALKMGNIVDEEGKMCDARQELIKIEDEIHKIQPDFQVGEQQYKEDQAKCRNLEQELKRTPSDDQVEKDYVAKRNKVEQLKAEAIRKNINPDDSVHEIVRLISQKKQDMHGFEQEKRDLMNQCYGLSFSYNKNAVDNSKVYGCMYELMKFYRTDEWGSPLEVACSGLLGHVVVHDDKTGKALLKANMNRRTNIHCLSVFQTANRRQVDQRTLDRQLGPGKAVPLLDLIEVDDRFRPIVQHYLGGKVLCDTIQTARHVAFKLGYPAISKTGDVVDPDGIMHGGSRQNLGRMLAAAQSLHTACSEVKRLSKEILQLEQSLETAKRNEEFMKQLQIAKRDLYNAEETRKLTKASMILQEVTALKEKLQIDGARLSEWKQQLDKLEKDRKIWKTKVDQLEGLREKSKKENDAQILKWEKALEAAKKKYDSKKKHFESIDCDIQSREAMIADCATEINSAKAELADCEKNLENVMEAFRTAEKKLQEKQAIYDEAIAESQQWNAEFNQLEEQIKTLNDKITKIDVTKIKRNNTKEKLEAAIKHADSEIKAMTSLHKTVNFETEKVPELEAKPLQVLKAELDKLNQTHLKLRERIDPDAAEKCDNTKALLVDSENRMKKLEQNRDHLQSAINRLDQHKLNRVLEAYDKINEEFNKMMDTLLPDSAAKLVPVNKDDLNQGLNIHVKLGSVWKESLGELSGGQKSLVALALTLSLCMYNPAPFYVLDEIDSALDLNHTQNIGVLIKRRFTGTQFICVSLKDGMYSNCNVLFQVQFLNGKSEVKRCVRQSSKKKDDEEDTSASKSKRARLVKN